MTAERRRQARASEVASALRDLDGSPARLAAGEWPGPFTDLHMAGLYSWWVDPSGAEALGDGLGQAIAHGRIYAGQTGATKWPSGTVGAATLAGRVGGNHIRGRVRGSTFRLTLAAALLDSLGLVIEAPKRLAPTSEAALTSWIGAHLEVAVHPFAERDALGDLEAKVLDALDPPLNLEGRPPTPVRQRLSELRRAISRAPDTATPGERRVRPTPTPASAAPPVRVGQPVTLHDEIATILREHGGSMTTDEIADAVNRRGRYAKKDGSAVTRFQIHGRTRNYPQLFKREGSRVRLA